MRVNWRWNSYEDPCDTGSYSDRDDLAFVVDGSLLLSTEENEFGSHGVMFDTFAWQKLRIVSFEVFSLYNFDLAPVKVYTRPGNYSGYEVDSNGWDLVFDDQVDFLGQELPTTILVDVTIPFESSQAFFVWSPDQKILFNLGSEEGALYSSNTYIDFYEGVSLIDIFSNDTDDVYSPRVLRGSIG